MKKETKLTNSGIKKLYKQIDGEANAIVTIKDNTIIYVPNKTFKKINSICEDKCCTAEELIDCYLKMKGLI